MGKSLRIMGLSLGIIVMLWISLRLTGLVSQYRMPTSSMSPSYPSKSVVITVKSLKYKYGDAIAFLVPTPEKIERIKAGEIWLKRLIGKEGDTVELRDGFAYVNNKMADIGYEILLLYKIGNSNFNPKLIEGINSDQLETIGSGYIFLSPKIATKLKDQLKLERIDLQDKEIEFEFPSTINQTWTNGNWGPIVVPEGKVFVLGDNRYNSRDSRAFGFLPIQSVLSKVCMNF
jgi:signal peptidase I